MAGRGFWLRLRLLCVPGCIFLNGLIPFLDQAGK